MNKKQRIVLILASLLLLLAFLFPQRDWRGDTMRMFRFQSYIPDNKETTIEFVTIGILSGIAFFVVADRKNA